MGETQFAGRRRVAGVAHRVAVLTPYFPSPAQPYSGAFIQSLNDRVGSTHGATYIVLTYRPLFGRVRYTGWRALLSATPKQMPYGERDVRSFTIPWLPRGLLPGVPVWALVRSLRPVLEEWNCDLLHAHAAYPTGAAAVRLGRQLGKPVVLSVHGSDILGSGPSVARRRRLCREALHGADRVVAISQALAHEVQLRAPGAKVEVIYTGVDVDGIDMLAPAEGLERAAPLEVVFVGNVREAKGIYDLLEAVHAVPEAALTIVGDPGDFDTSNPRFLALLAESRVRILGPMSNAEAIRVIKWADLLCLPSHSEGLGMVLLEAAACGKPVVATRVGGIPEVVLDGITGFLIGARDPSEIATRLKTLTRAPDLLQRMGAAARIQVKERFDLNRGAKRMAEVYQEVLGRA